MADGFPYDLFLSHNRAQKDWVRELARRLRDDNFQVWFDEWVLPKHAGRNWIDLLAKGVEQSRKVVLVWSPEFFANEWPTFESAVVQQIDPVGRKERVLPLIHTQCDVPGSWGFRERLDFTNCLHGTVEFEFRYHQLLHNLDHSRPFEGDIEYFKRGQRSSDATETRAKLVNQAVMDLRKHANDDIRGRCGTIRVLTMVQPVELGSIYTDVNILEKRTSSSRRTLSELVSYAQQQSSADLGPEDGFKRLPAFEAVERHHRLLVYGKPGAGKTTLAKRLAYNCICGAFRPEFVPTFCKSKSIRRAETSHKFEGLHELALG